MKTLLKSVKAALAILNDSAKDRFAKYEVTDNYGTYQLCWTMRGAESWLPFCSDAAYIRETYDYGILVKRVQGA